MPIKMIVMVKRKPGLSVAAFRAGYENSHSRIAVELFGHLWTAYRRNYLITGHSFAGVANAGPDVIGYDAISEFILKDEAALAEMGRIGAANRDRIKNDEALWFDPRHCWSVACETVEEALPQASPQ